MQIELNVFNIEIALSNYVMVALKETEEQLIDVALLQFELQRFLHTLKPYVHATYKSHLNTLLRLAIIILMSMLCQMQMHMHP